MSRLGKVMVAIAGSLVALAGIGWVGFRVPPRSFPPPPDTTRDRGTDELPGDLPGPVYRHFRATVGSQVPRIESAVVWGKARIRTGLWMPLRFKAHYVPGQDFYRYMEVTWFGLPIMKGTDSYLNGEGMMNIGGNISSGEKINQGQLLTLWAEAVWMPSALVTHPDIRWEAVDAVTARLVVPFGEGEETLLVKFDPESGLMTHMSGLRYRGQEETKTPWRVEILEWKTIGPVMVPARSTLTWEDEGSPWSYWTIEGIAYNVDVSEKIPGERALSR